MASSRSGKALKNAIVSIIYEIVMVICGLILPRLILVNFGSEYNGITTSITQFISCIVLMKAGIGGATKAALYKPLAENNNEEINMIISQTQSFMRRIALIFVVFVLIFAVIYPVFICTDFDWWFSFSLILIIAFSTFIQYYFGITYELLLAADMKQYIKSAADIAMVILNTIISVLLINMNCTIHMVKLGSSLVHIIGPIFICIYSRKKYNIKNNIRTKVNMLPQKWEAVAHEAANFVNTNTAVVIITLFSTMANVSIYTVYNMIIINIRSVLLTFTTSFGAAFGNMYAKKEFETMNRNLNIFELVIFSLVAIIYSATLLLLVPFALLYTKGVTDAEYGQPLFSALITIAGALSCIRIPYQTIITSAGEYKGIRNGAIIEAVLNITISVIMVINFGLIGVACGSLAAAVFRSIQFIVYLKKHILFRSYTNFIKHMFVLAGVFTATCIIYRIISFSIDSWTEWILSGILIVIISSVLTLITDLIFFLPETRLLFNKLVNVIRKKTNRV